MTADAPSARAQRAKKLAERATEGPWEWDDDPAMFGNGELQKHQEDLASERYDFWPTPIIQTDGGVYGPEEADRIFIAESRTLLPQLADDVLALQSTLAQAGHSAQQSADEAAAQHAADQREIVRLHAALTRVLAFAQKDGPLSAIADVAAIALAAEEPERLGLECAGATLIAENDRLRAAITAYLRGDYPHAEDNRQCPHGLYSWNACEQCIDGYFERVLAPQEERKGDYALHNTRT